MGLGNSITILILDSKRLFQNDIPSLAGAKKLMIQYPMNFHMKIKWNTLKQIQQSKSIYTCTISRLTPAERLFTSPPELPIPFAGLKPKSEKPEVCKLKFLGFSHNWFGVARYSQLWFGLGLEDVAMSSIPLVIKRINSFVPRLKNGLRRNDLNQRNS